MNYQTRLPAIDVLTTILLVFQYRVEKIPTKINYNTIKIIVTKLESLIKFTNSVFLTQKWNLITKILGKVAKFKILFKKPHYQNINLK